MLLMNRGEENLNETAETLERQQTVTLNTYRFFTLSTETVATLKAGNLQLVSIIDKPI